MKRFLVVDCEFNRTWAPHMIGSSFDSPPGDLAVVPYEIDQFPTVNRKEFDISEN